MSLSRSERRDLYIMAHEIMDTSSGASAMPFGEERSGTSKGETGHGMWLDWAIDMLNIAGGDRDILDSVYLRTVEGERERRTQEETRAIRKYWKEVGAAKLLSQGLNMLEKMEAA